MNQLKLIIKNEYLTDVRSKSFWISTIIFPILMGGFSIFLGYLMDENDATANIANPAAPDPDEISGMGIAGMFTGIFLALFLMIYGAQIYTKVKKEKCNRVMEILATCVTGRTMMLAKIISVALIGFTQLFVWGFLAVGILIFVILLTGIGLPWDIITDYHTYVSIVWSVLYFIGGYLIYGSLYAACGAMTDKDNENQGYMTFITMMALSSFYIGEYAVFNAGSALTQFCLFFPFTSSTIGAVVTVAGEVPLWESILSIVVIYAFAWVAIAISGKIYTSSLLLKGKKFTPKDLLLFLKTK